MKKSVLLVEGGLDNKFFSTIAFKMYKNVTPVFVRDFPKFCPRFSLTYTFEENYLYFKFFVRYKNGRKNRRIKQMKIKWQNESV